MNRELLKNILIFTTGVGVGVLLTNKIMKQKYEDIVQEELVSIRETRTRVDSDEEGMVKEEVKEEKILVMPNSRVKKVMRQYNATNDAQELYEEAEKIYNKEVEVPERPIIITVEEFFEGNSDHDKLTLTYYEDDGVLVDENEEIIDDPEYIIGSSALVSFGEGSDDPEIVYVRNYRISTDFEIVRLSKSYKDTVMGPESDSNE